jgi:acyl-CoA synthetase (AMP-forming)/AMP-acid ligase II
VPDRRWGEMVVAALVPASGSHIDTAAVEGFARERLASYKVPKRWAVVEGLPMTVSGKVQKYLLQQQWR